MTSFPIPRSLINLFERQANPIGYFIDQAERTSGHVILLENGEYSVVSDFEVSFRKLKPLYSSGVGFIFNESGVSCN